MTELQVRLRDFAARRDWDRFHTPKNLASALSVEAGELLEIFQWLTAEQSASLSVADRARVQEEIADVAIYLLTLADVLGVDLEEVISTKIEQNAEKYPVALARGNATKRDARSAADD